MRQANFVLCISSCYMEFYLQLIVMTFESTVCAVYIIIVYSRQSNYCIFVGVSVDHFPTFAAW